MRISDWSSDVCSSDLVDYKRIIKWKLISSSHNFPFATLSVAILGRKKAMKNLQNSDELIDLGAISVETRGIEPVGPRDEDTNQHSLFVGGITTDDCQQAPCRFQAAHRMRVYRSGQIGSSTSTERE